MPTSETFDFEGPVGRLEAILMGPERPPVAAAVVCHAHPLHGGMMHFKVVFRPRRRCRSRASPCCASTSAASAAAKASTTTATASRRTRAPRSRSWSGGFPGAPLVLGGFSFGSVVALRVAARDARVRAVAALGFPLVRFGDASVLQAPSQPRLFVQGERDEFGAGETLRALVEPLPPPRELVVVPGASHFFDGQLDAVQERSRRGPEAAVGTADEANGIVRSALNHASPRRA